VLHCAALCCAALCCAAHVVAVVRLTHAIEQCCVLATNF
jgi:hypothetical protein